MSARYVRFGGWLLGLLGLVPGLTLAASDGTGIDPVTNKPWCGQWMSPAYSSVTEARVKGTSLDAAYYYMITTGYVGQYIEEYQSCTAGDDAWNKCHRFRRYQDATKAVWYGNTDTGGRKFAADNPAGGIWSQCTVYDPPPEVDCAALANVKTLGSATDQPDSFVPQDTICVKSANVGGVTKTANCAAFKLADQPWRMLGPTGARDHLVRYQFTGLECDAEPEQTPTQPMDTEDTPDKCHTANGLTWCENTDDTQNCGFVNNKYTCLDSLGTDKCMAMADGSRLCVETAPTPPVPDSGTPGVKATPDSNMSVCTGANSCTQYNYYNSTTSSGSSRDPGTGPNSDGSGTVGPGGAAAGTGDGTEEEGQGSASGGQSCDAAPTCSGDPIQCAVLEQQWRTRCTEMPTESELEALMPTKDAQGGDGIARESYTHTSTSLTQYANGWGGGSCPNDYTANMGGIFGSVTIPLSELCGLFQVISIFVMIGAYVASARIIVGGF